MEFCARKTKEALIVWIRAWFEKNGRDCNAVIGISTRNSVNRILHRLKEDGIIDLHGQRIFVLDLQYLQQYVQE